MTELSNETKIKIYKAALNIQKAELDEPELIFRGGLCNAISHGSRKVGTWYELFEHYTLTSRFPEIMKHKPKHNKKPYWFTKSDYGIKKRVKILEQAIAELEAQ